MWNTLRVENENLANGGIDRDIQCDFTRALAMYDGALRDGLAVDNVWMTYTRIQTQQKKISDVERARTTYGKI